MTNAERIKNVFDGKPVDRMPILEWATWWTQTVDNWYKQGLDSSVNRNNLYRHFGLDEHKQFWLRVTAETCPSHTEPGAELIENESDYEKLLPYLYPENSMDGVVKEMKALESEHIYGNVSLWFTLEGAFWFPRKLFGIENHLYSFYDYPKLYHRICEDLADFQISQMEEIYKVATPEFMTIAEDMSYNNGPMLSKDCFYEFLAPYYRRVVPYIKEHGTKVIIDSDGDITMMVPWLRDVGIDGVLPLERQAGVDVNKLRADFPELILIGGFDKMVMDKGEEAIRSEFERILPCMKSGRYIASVDHQTPPAVTLDDYGLFLKLFREYAEKAAK